MKKEKKITRNVGAFGLLFLLFAVIVCSASIGSSSLSVIDSLKILCAKIPLVHIWIPKAQVSVMYEKIVWDIRMPRIILAGLTGSGLAVVGATFQGIFRNPLADPHILGISSGAAVGATIAIVSGASMSVFGFGMIGALAFVGALVTVVLVYRISCVGNKLITLNIILTGTAISMMLSSLISLMMSFHHDEIEKVYLWTLGSFSSATWPKVSFLVVFVTIGICVILLCSKELDAIATGNDIAQSLGIDTIKVRKILIVFASLLVAACVSVSGIIGFVGLVIPHCVRFLSGPKHKNLLPFSALGGAIFMILCDTIGRNIVAPSELPVGVITAILGTPYFIFLLYRNKRKLGGR